MTSYQINALSRTEKLQYLIKVSSTRINNESRLDLLAAIAGKAESSKIVEHSEIAKSSVKGNIPASFLMSIADVLGITKEKMITYFSENY